MAQNLPSNYTFKVKQPASVCAPRVKATCALIALLQNLGINRMIGRKVIYMVHVQKFVDRSFE
jgi:hypothetical protein